MKIVARSGAMIALLLAVAAPVAAQDLDERLMDALREMRAVQRDLRMERVRERMTA